MNVARNIRLLQIRSALANALFLIPVIVPYYRDEIGIGYREFMIGEAVFAAVVLLMEVPTGWLSDVWSRRRTMIVSMIFGFIGFSTLALADSFAMAITAQAIIGISVSLMSGTDSAMLYDTLLDLGREGEYRRLQGRQTAVMFYSVAGASVLGGFLYEWNHHLPLFLSLVTEAAALIVAYFLVEPARHKQPVRKHPVSDMLETMRYALHGHKEVAGLILLSGVLFASTKIMMWSQQPYYILLDVPVAWFGVLMACGYLLGGAGSHFGHLLDGRFSNRNVLLACLGFILMSCLASGLAPGWHGISLLLFSGSALYGFGWPRVQAAINKNVDSSRRATILSTASFTISVFQTLACAFSGWVEGRYGIAVSLLALAGILIVAGAISGMLLRRK